LPYRQYCVSLSLGCFGCGMKEYISVGVVPGYFED
jgi:hypothetical protein